MGVVSYFPSIYEQPDFKTYTMYQEDNGNCSPVTGAYTCYNFTDNSYTGNIYIGNVPEHVILIANSFNRPIIIPETIKCITHMFNVCRNFYSDIYVKTNQIDNVANFLQTVKGANVYIRPEMETLFRTSNSLSVKGSSITWTNDTANNCFYNTSYNLKVIYNYEG